MKKTVSYKITKKSLRSGQMVQVGWVSLNKHFYFFWPKIKRVKLFRHMHSRFFLKTFEKSPDIVIQKLEKKN